MSTTENPGFSREDVARVAVKAVEGAKEPLTLKKIDEQLPRPFRVGRDRLLEILKEQCGRGGIYEWVPQGGRKRFWRRDPEDYAGEVIPDLLSGRTMTRTQLRDALKRRLFGCSRTKAEEMMKRCLPPLIQKRHLYPHPPTPRKRAQRFGTHPPDPAPYLGKLRKEFEAVCRRLKDAGVSPGRVLEAFSGMVSGRAEAGPSEESPKPRAEGVHPRDVSGLILQKALEIEPAAGRQVLVTIRDLRAALSLPESVFDRAILDLAGEGKIWLHRDAFPAQAKESDVVRDGRGNCYMGIVLRS